MLEPYVQEFVDQQMRRRAGDRRREDTARLLESFGGLREGSYQTGDGRSVYYDDGAGTLRDAADLYTVLDEQHTTGSPNLENEQARMILDKLQTGGGLGVVHLGTLQKLLTKHAAAIAKLRKSPDRDGQDRLDMPSAGPDSLISPAKAQEAAAGDEDVEAMLDRFREVSGKPRGSGLFDRLGLDRDGSADRPASDPGRIEPLRLEPELRERRLSPLREAEQRPVSALGALLEDGAPVPDALRSKVDPEITTLQEALVFGQVGLYDALGLDVEDVVA